MKPSGYWNIKENCENFAKDCKNLTELRKKSYGCYLGIKRNGWERELFPSCAMKQMGFWNSKENCFEEAQNYSTIHELQRKNYGCYKGLERNGWLYEAFPLKDGVKQMNYWNDKENCLNESKKYGRLIDLINGSKSCYQSIKRHKWNDEMFSAYTKSFEYDDLKKEIHCVYVYELNDFNTCYVGRTKDMHSRDLSHRRGRKHHDGTITYDSLFLFCQENEIDIPTPIVKEDNLNAEESLIQEDYWCNYYKDDGWNVLNKAKTGKNSGSLGSVKKWDYESCKEFAKNYTYKSELKKANYSCYAISLKNGWFEEFGIKDKKDNPNGTWNDKEKCLEEARKYSSVAEFVRNSYGAYNGLKKNGWLDEIKFLNQSKNPTLDFKEVYEKYKELNDVRKVEQYFHTSYYKLKKLFSENGARFNGHGDVELSKDDENTIIGKYHSGQSITSLSKEYNIGKRRLQKILNN